MLKVSKSTLLFIAGFVWCLAGGNIAWLGIQEFLHTEHDFPWLLVLGAVVIFTVFHMAIFSKMVIKHAARIASYPAQRLSIWRFFDVPGYIMMAIMMSGGIALRAFRLVPLWFIAFFYTGLGIALALSGISFLIRALRRDNRSVPCPFRSRIYIL